MPEKLVYVKPIEVKNEIMSRKWLNNYGSYNHIPEPYLKIDEYTFADIAKRGSPDYFEFRMVSSIEKGKYLPAYVYWYDDGGLMVMFDHNSPLMEFYHIGCLHEFDEEIGDKGDHNLTCKVCGYKDIIYDEEIIAMKSE